MTRKERERQDTKIYNRKRPRCKHPGCITRLSCYNPGPFCFAHTPGMVVHEHTPRTQCASGCGKREEQGKTDPIILKPGDPEFNCRAFSTEIMGFINENHEFEPLVLYK